MSRKVYSQMQHTQQDTVSCRHSGTAQVKALLGPSAEEGEHTCEHCRTFLSLNLKNIFALRRWHLRVLTSDMHLHWERATKLKG